jgi:2,4-dienoyl-CoA reductase-like NADH-dependent reductase (Old Yellow Enzyme family)
MANDEIALLTPMRIRGVELKNRMVLAPMQVYTGADGHPTDWHFQHLAKFAGGGFGTVFTEALAVTDTGRNTYGDLGVWSDEFVPSLRRIADMLRGLGATPAAQLFHAGPKASRQRPWEGYGPIGEAEAARGEAPWQPVAPSPDARVEGWLSPRALTVAEIQDLVRAYGEGARRCAEADFDIVEIHGAHGYLIHSFYSPLGNDRTDDYGGSRAGRMRFPLEVAEAVRAAWPVDKPLFFRMSCVDGEEGGWTIEDSIAFTRELALRGVDLIDCSSRGIGASPTARVLARVPGFQVPYADRIRRETGVPTMAVGLILKGRQAEDILRSGSADLVCVAREALYDPNWALHAVQEVGGDADWERWPPQYGWWLSRRAEQLRLAEIEDVATGGQRR